MSFLCGFVNRDGSLEVWLAKSQKKCVPSWVDEDDKLNLIDPLKVNATRIFVGTFTVFGDQDCEVACEDFLTKKEYYSFGEEVTLPKEAWETLSNEEVFYSHGEEDVDISTGDRSTPHVFLTKGRIGGKVYSQCPRWAKKKEFRFLALRGLTYAGVIVASAN